MAMGKTVDRFCELHQFEPMFAPQDSSLTDASAAPDFQSFGIGAGAVAQQPASEGSSELSETVLGYIERMLMAQYIDLRTLEHHPEDPSPAAGIPFFAANELPPAPHSQPISCSSNFSSSSSADGADGGGVSFVPSFDGPVDAAAGDGGGFMIDNNGCWYEYPEYEQLESHQLPYQGLDSFSTASVSGADLQWVESLLMNSPVAEEADLQPRESLRPARVDASEGHDDGRATRVRKHEDECESPSGEGPRSSKQTAVYTEQLVREMMDKVLLGSSGVKELREALKNSSAATKKSGGAKGRGRRQVKKEVVDLDTILLQCAQAVATNDRRSAGELLKQIRQHSSPSGDGRQRLAHWFAEGLEARLAGTGRKLYQTCSALAGTVPAVDILKAYQLFVAACPFKRLSYFFSSQTILNAVETASKVHIIDYGVYYGFQWPWFLQRLAQRPGGPPRLRITGIDPPLPGLRPAERMEETGRYLREYARAFGVPFEFHPIPCKWEDVRVEDVGIEEDEVVVVNSLYKFKILADESVVSPDSPRDVALNTIRRMKPAVFIHGIVSGSYSAPFFITRFREALYHFSALFDMLEANVPRQYGETRMLIEAKMLGREAMNVVSCEGPERVERPETYKQWSVRNRRAGFRQLPLDEAIVNKAKAKVKRYHKEYCVVDEDQRWLLQGWKGRILYALSAWTPHCSPSSP